MLPQSVSGPSAASAGEVEAVIAARVSPEGWWLPACCAASAVVLGLTLQLTNGTLRPDAVLGLTGALGLCAAGGLGPRAPRWPDWGEGLFAALLAGALLWQLHALYRAPPAIYLRVGGPWPLADFHFRLAAAALVSGALLAGPDRLRRFGVPVLLVLYVLVGVWVLQTSPSPVIDVFVFQTQGPEALLRGVNPYAMTFPNIYGHSRFYGEGLVAEGRLQFGFPYPPLSLYLSLLGKVLGGDPRYAQLLAQAGAAGLMAWARGGRLGTGLAALFLLTPRGPFVLEQAWTEPLILFFLAGVVFCACRAPRVLPYALGLLLAIKQYTVFVLPLVVLLTPLRGRALWGVLWRAGVTAAVISLPLVVPDVKAFLHSVVALQVHQPFRMDALSYLSWWASQGHPPPPIWIPFVAVAVVTGLALWRAPRTPAGFAASVALVFCVFFAFNKQAFCNYYYFVVGTLCLAAAAAWEPVRRG